MDHGVPLGMKRIAVTQLEKDLQSRAKKLSAQYGYKSNRDWEDTVKYWTDEGQLRAVSFINSSYEYTTVHFDRQGKWLQTSAYLNPEFKETSAIVANMDEKGYQVQSLNSPIGPIIEYQTIHDTWYEAEVYNSRTPQTIELAQLDKKFHFIGMKK